MNAKEVFHPIESGAERAHSMTLSRPPPRFRIPIGFGVRALCAAFHLAFAMFIAFGQTNSTFDIRASGAKGDGRSLDTVAINRAIEECSSAAGGQVRVRPTLERFHFPNTPNPIVTTNVVNLIWDAKAK